MKEKIFNEMRKMGWNLNDFNYVLEEHIDFIDNLCQDFVDNGLENVDLTNINKQSLNDMLTFISDFLRALKEIDTTTETYEEKMVRLAKEDYNAFINHIDSNRNYFYEESIDRNNNITIQVFTRDNLMDEDEFVMSAMYCYYEKDDKYRYMGE